MPVFVKSILFVTSKCALLNCFAPVLSALTPKHAAPKAPSVLSTIARRIISSLLVILYGSLSTPEPATVPVTFCPAMASYAISPFPFSMTPP